MEEGNIMEEIVSELSTNLFMTYILRRYMNLFFDTDIENQWKEWGTYILFYICTSIVHLIFRIPVLKSAMDVMMVFLITQKYQGKWKKKIFLTILIYGISMVCNILIHALVKSVIGIDNSSAIVFVISLLIGICEYFIERFIVKNKKSDMQISNLDLMLSIFIVSIIILGILTINETDNEIANILVSTGILIINLLIFNIYDEFIDARERLEENAVFKNQARQYSNQLVIMLETIERVKSLRHDLKYHINEIMLLANKVENEELKKYVQDMNEFLIEPKEYISSGNMEIDSLLNLMLDKATKELRKVDYLVQVPKDFNIKTFDLNIIIGNLLENAIDAALESDKKTLTVHLYYESGILYINIKNSYNGELKKEKGKYISTKEKQNKHGIGLENVKKVVHRYNGTLKIDDLDNIFNVEVMLYIPNSE